MAITYKVIYKNHCTPQEQILSNGRYYLDSDCGRKLTGNCETSASLASSGSYNANLVVADNTPSASLTSSSTFIFIKNTGGGSGNDVLVTLDDSNYYIVLSEGEAFTSEIHASAVVKVKCGSGETSTVEFFVGK